LLLIYSFSLPELSDGVPFDNFTGTSTFGAIDEAGSWGARWTCGRANGRNRAMNRDADIATHTPKITVAFFGITRSLQYTISSIEQNILRPARAAGDVSVIAHFFDLERVKNPRTGEDAPANRGEHALLSPDWLSLTPPNTILDAAGFEDLKSFGDVWEDDFRTLSNLVHQLYSLRVVTEKALRDQSDIVMFCRPDLEYHDSFEDGIRKAIAQNGDAAFLPQWQRHKGGFNDRFAICTGVRTIAAYGSRLDTALKFCQDTGLPLHSERLVKFALKRAGIPTYPLDVRASRDRAKGRVEDEDFSLQSWKSFRNSIKMRLLHGF